MSKINKSRPVPSRISQWDTMTEIIYRCANCKQEFSFYGSNEKFCHSCGLKQDWKGYKSNCTKDFSGLYYCNESCDHRDKVISMMNPVTGDVYNEFKHIYDEELSF